MVGSAFFLKHTSFTGEDRFKKFRESVGTPEAMRPAQPSGDDGAQRERNQRRGHRYGRFVDMVLHVVTHARATMESQIHQAEHVERGHQIGRESDIPEKAVGPPFARPGLPENRIFGKEASKREDAILWETRSEEHTSELQSLRHLVC